MAWEHILQVRQLRVSHVTKVILYALGSRTNEAGECWPSISTLCRDSGLAERAVQFHLRKLVDQDLPIRQDRRGRVALLRLTLDVACTGARGAPVHGAARGGAPGAPHPRMPCAKPPQEAHPRLKEKEPRSLPGEEPVGGILNVMSGRQDEVPDFNWWETNSGIDAGARELGVQARPGESYLSFKVRVIGANKFTTR